MTHVYTSFCTEIRGHRYTRRLILRPISAARPRIDLFTKNPPGGELIKGQLFANWGKLRTPPPSFPGNPNVVVVVVFIIFR